MFQSTYLYKVRQTFKIYNYSKRGFNPRTYIRYDPICKVWLLCPQGFNPRTYIRYDPIKEGLFRIYLGFNPRTYIRYDLSKLLIFSSYNGFQSTYLYKVRPKKSHFLCSSESFNPRTYIRYDCITNNANIYSLLSMHLCDNKLFGFFIDEIKLIGVFNRLIINDCENSSFLLMLNVRKQLYYKFIFYIIGCDDTYVFNSFRIIISQEIETNTIFFMIDDIR